MSRSDPGTSRVERGSTNMSWTCECCQVENEFSNATCSGCTLAKGTQPAYQRRTTGIDEALDWKNLRSSENVEDRRDAINNSRSEFYSSENAARVIQAASYMSSGQKAGLALLLLVGLILVWALDIDINSLQPLGPDIGNSKRDQEVGKFVAKVLGETEDVWLQQLPLQTKITYLIPKLVLFRHQTQSACGGAESSMGPFYCPVDRKVYLDTAFFHDMDKELGGGGNLAYAYVIAHEIGHHIENLLGVLDTLHRYRTSGTSKIQVNHFSVRVELMADCLAGVWSFHMNVRHHNVREEDVKHAISAASAIGDDRLQKASRGYAVPDSFTHGTSQERVRAYMVGFTSGTIHACAKEAGLTIPALEIEEKPVGNRHEEGMTQGSGEYGEKHMPLLPSRKSTRKFKHITRSRSAAEISTDILTLTPAYTDY
eukprot:gb/GEZN01008387.1/.p1 GENE.gb/GEZN01008387.1/~~gb/GEZN01008387.1/.p1  ORF type:complete len:427 (+),score=10.18 gb/GEZN01008387.1/:49-1329(+)